MTERKIILSENAGFCPGVRRADELVRQILDKNSDSKIFTLGKLIHNRLYNDNLAKQGISPIEFQEIEPMLSQTSEAVILISRTHGITKQESEILSELQNKYPNFTVYDMTCPYVKRVHEVMRKHTFLL